MTTLLEPAPVDPAASQHGLFTTRQALRAGLSPSGPADAVKEAPLLHLARGLYAVRSPVERGSPVSWHRTLTAGSPRCGTTPHSPG